MIDFTKAKEEFNNYRGSEKKKTLVIDNKRYLVKFPDPIREKNKNISYINNAYSEYVGSNIFRLSGFNVQNTILGKYYYNDKDKIVCGCEDFTDENHILYEFERMALSINPDKKIGNEIDDIIETFDEMKDIIDVEDTKNKFWNMFIIDALIGNTDRHNGNFGFILNKETNEFKFSPIYDCGSCLNPMLSDEDIKLLNDTEIKNLAINSYSCLRENDKKINPLSYIKNNKNIDITKALLRIFDKIDINGINNFINSINVLSNVRKDFYKNIINIRYNILKDTYNKLTR